MPSPIPPTAPTACGLARLGAVPAKPVHALLLLAALGTLLLFSGIASPLPYVNAEQRNGEIAATIAAQAFTDLDAPVRRLCGPDVPAVPFSHPLQDWFMPNPDKIAQAIRELAAY